MPKLLFQQNLYIFLAKPLPLGKTYEFSWVTYTFKPIPLDETSIFSWLNHYTLTKVLIKPLFIGKTFISSYLNFLPFNKAFIPFWLHLYHLEKFKTLLY
jgi:hypothetical protein